MFVMTFANVLNVFMVRKILNMYKFVLFGVLLL